MIKFTEIIRRHALLIIVLILFFVPFMMSQYEYYVLQRGVQNIIHVIGLLILIGYGGMLSLGNVAFLALGAYIYAILLVKLGLSPWLGMLIAIGFTTLMGIGLAFPSFKLRGPFLGVTTMGFGEIVRILLLNLEPITGGAYGLSGYANLLPNSQWIYYLMLVTIVLVVIGAQRICKSKLGLVLNSIKEDEVAAEVIGIDVKRAKLVAFALSAMLGGLSGVFLANLMGYISPDCFTSAESATYLLMVVMGGMKSVIGTLISTIAVTSLPEILRFLSSSRLLVYSLILLIYIRLNWVKPDKRLSIESMVQKLRVINAIGKARNRSEC